MAKKNTFNIETLGLHAGQEPDSSYGTRAQPIHFSTSYVFPDTETAASLFNMERGGHVYSRISNPTNAVLEERISAMEGGVGGIATASGQAALHLAISTLMEVAIILSRRVHCMVAHTIYSSIHYRGSAWRRLLSIFETSTIYRKLSHQIQNSFLLRCLVIQDLMF